MDLTKKQKQKPVVHAQPTETEVVQPVRSNHTTVSVPASSSQTPTHSFVSKIRGLSLNLMRPVKTATGEGWAAARVEFRDGTFSTDDEELAEVMKSHASYGGSSLRQYTDRPPVAREALFWIGALPEEIRRKMKDDTDGLTRDHTAYEDPMKVT